MEKSTMPATFNDHHNWFESSLQSLSESAEMLYTYKHVVHGFSTRLTNQKAEVLSKQPGILSLMLARLKIITSEQLLARFSSIKFQ
ncbi:hypothetical protein HN873_056739 [Arachis hypogaea]